VDELIALRDRLVVCEDDDKNFLVFVEGVKSVIQLGVASELDLSRQFEVPVITIRRWWQGAARPSLLIQKYVIEELRKKVVNYIVQDSIKTI